MELAAALKMEQQNELEKKARENQISDETMKCITEEIAKLPECAEKGRPMVLNFPYWLALFKILNFNVNKESFTLREAQKAKRRECLKNGGPQAY